MKITCSQMDVLISFYIEEELSSTLREQVEKHLQECSTCRAKYDIIKSMINELHESYDNDSGHFSENIESYTNNNSQQYRLFKTNLSAYIDNELSSEDNIKVKKFTINNKHARKELEDSYNIRKLMNNSFKKAKMNTKNDFSKVVMKNLQPDEVYSFGIHPAIKLIIAFVTVVFVITSFILVSLTV